jgi:adenylate cyclase
MTGNLSWLRRGLGIGLLMGLLGALNLFAGWERIAFDARSAFVIRWGTERAAVPITVVAIDDATLEQVGRWPWPRAQLADLFEQIKQQSPAALCVDIILAEPSPDDAKLSAALTGVNTVLPVYSKESTVVRPLARLLDNTHLGHIEVYIDPDSVVRSVPSNRAGYLPLGVYAARLYKSIHQPLDQSVEGNIETSPSSIGGRYWLDLRLRSGAVVRTWSELVDTVSAADLLAGCTPAQLITDRLVIIGVTAAGTVGVDQHVTPLRAWGAIPGVYLHAALAASELLGRHMVRLNAWSTLVITLLAGLLGGLMARASRYRTAQLALTILIYLIIAQLTHSYLSLWIPVASPLLTVTALVGWADVEQRLVKERERRQLRRLFARYVPDEVMPEILRHSSELGLAGVQRDVVVMFADMRGFTTLAEQLQPEQVLQIVNLYLEALAGAVRQYGGMVDKYLGDGLMALFGAPVPHTDAVQAAVYCAIEMHARVEKLMHTPGLPQLPRIGIGIHVGEAILGTIGGKERMEYTVMGDVVNVAARLEELARAGTILLSDECVVQLHDERLLELCKPLGEQSVRGKQRSLQVYEISYGIEGTN